MDENHPEYRYLQLLQDILDNGEWKISHSTGVKLKSVFGRQIRFDLSQGFPLLTTKKVFVRGIIHELIWFLSGSSNIKYLVENNVHIWDEWAYKKYSWAMEAKKQKAIPYEEFTKKIAQDKKFLARWGELGPVYGVQWRRWPAFADSASVATSAKGAASAGKPAKMKEIDQLGWAIEKIKKYPQKKHYIISAWNAGSIYEMSGSHSASMVIAPCHTMYHINITGDKLSLLLYQRSADSFLGVPFNIASYALLTLMLAQVTGYKPGDFVHTFGDIHIYENHFDQVKEQLKRTPRPLPVMKINPEVKNIDNFKFSDFEVVGYDPHPPIRGEITVVGGF
ncbi:thymidylate synthase [Candidatus Gottesmanbacteria bacterium RIFCSPHIGHO2_01_FULL_42_27]|uniref:Thymidylate synthase n=2 Tax=Candidatus Gottesmaniibacteriota TaxID=1752720 RepID=A0A1F6BHU1_9BACT|nr:MAG: thymidylate synthase [Candidatus Gottesmanbacteria bacterium RIFCSPHIGHO2_01_FULL_42_27]OGG22934.1 MAG: thymidylate synthase [Candidatus Gottesmanbacteria bacterium RIFCSPHIGHO2_12_FULL_43_26]OGG36352.1 MAG: thymidylate synthase [Candidatus Gottesmanbacteria bacterium RIFCSPLOWO2_01_FULL_42_22]